MAEREVEKWITIHGRHIPIYEDSTDKDVYEEKVDSLPDDNGPFPDTKKTPLPCDTSKMMEVVFGDWKEKDSNFEGLQEVDINDIVAVQPLVQAEKLKKMFGYNTDSVKVLKIGDKYYLGDGNHRIVAAYLRGDEKVKVQVYRR